jgi:hypothetical protein
MAKLSVKQILVATRDRMIEKGREGWTAGAYRDGDRCCAVGHGAAATGISAPVLQNIVNPTVWKVTRQRYGEECPIYQVNDIRGYDETLDVLYEAAVIAPNEPVIDTDDL